MDTLLQDVRYALRTLGRSRMFAASAVLCLALGIGVNTAVFSLVNAILLRPYGFADQDRVVSLLSANPRQGVREMDVSAVDFWQWREESRTLDAVAALVGGNFALAGDEADAERVEGMYVTPNVFTLLGVPPTAGRQLAESDGRRGGAPLVVLSHGLWERRYGADPRVVGDAVLLNGVPHTVVGVMPRGFGFPETAQLWVPFEPSREARRSNRNLWVIGRLAAGSELADVQSELATLALRAAEADPEAIGWTAQVMSFRDQMVDGPLRMLLALMSAAVGFVLLIACANVANLLLARASARQRELAVRAALGGTRGRLVRQMLTESVIVAVAGGALGVFIAVWWLDAMLAAIPEQLPYWLVVELDGRVLAFTALVSVLTGVLFGALPALRASRPDLQSTLKAGGRWEIAGGGRLRGALVAGEIALAIMLLTAATLMTRAFLTVERADAGFDTRGLLTMRTSLVGPRYDSVAARAAYLDDAVRRLAALPGVRGAVATTAIPTDDGGPLSRLDVEGRPAAARGDELLVSYFGSTPGLFEVLERPMVEGRGFTAQEASATGDAPSVAIVGAALARRLWPDGDAVGRRVRLAALGDSAWFTVVGVAPDLLYEEVGEETAQSRLQVHLPYHRLGWRNMALLVRGADAGALAPSVRRVVRAADPTLPTYDVRTMAEVRRFTMWPHRVFSTTFASFAAIALLLAAVGVYGVMSYHVSQRVRAIGVRLALGASPRQVLGDVMRHGATLAGVGSALGILGALGVGRAMSGVLYGVGGADPIALVGVPLVLGAVALLACYLPARRATRIDPLTALRSE